MNIYLSTVVDVSFLLVGGLSRVVDTIDAWGDSWRSLALFDILIVRPPVVVDVSLGSFLLCVVDVTWVLDDGTVDGNDGPCGTRLDFVDVVVAVVLVLLLLGITGSGLTLDVDLSTRRYRE